MATENHLSSAERIKNRTLKKRNSFWYHTMDLALDCSFSFVTFANSPQLPFESGSTSRKLPLFGRRKRHALGSKQLKSEDPFPSGILSAEILTLVILASERKVTVKHHLSPT
ncbi:hypothetical protein AVEN_253646-1 [Araneus ventricosus]|uniref:Uncharacterized protein n=1 Tax=Araneus ventricosus TaxID=182803 RepID=A0A4Y2LQS5_ARAVE|nr:hypothetical protein AVEN_253646-1 [Araneus ventricosus]